MAAFDVDFLQLASGLKNKWARILNLLSRKGTYRGQMKNGKFHGEGTYVWSAGHKYVGEWVDGQAHGRGMLIWANADVYIGDWRYGKAHGRGVYTFSGNIYHGMFVNGDIQGHGTMTSSRGISQHGEFGKKLGTTKFNKLAGVSRTS